MKALSTERAMDSASQWFSATDMPRGLPRPRYDGRPVPYIAHVPLLSGRPQFREVNWGRKRECQSLWLCQVCGLALDMTAYVVARTLIPNVEVVDDTALHCACLALASSACPFFRQVHTCIVVRRDDIRFEGGRMCFIHPPRLP